MGKDCEVVSITAISARDITVTPAFPPRRGVFVDVAELNGKGKVKDVCDSSLKSMSIFIQIIFPTAST
jgi:hypothetical protein